MKKTTTALFALALGLLAAGPVSAQAYPSKPIRFFVPLPPGSALDVVARTLGDSVSRKIGQPFTVENRAGANTNIATDACAKAAPDGYTICLVTYSISLNPHLYPSMPFDVVRDLAPITNLVNTYDVLLMSATVPANNLQELIAYSKANPGKINFGSLGVGGAPHLIPDWLARQSNVSWTHVPYKGTGDIIQALVTGDVHLSYLTLGGPGTAANIKAGKLKVLFVYSKQRHPLIPDVPTMAEAGVPDYGFQGWWGLAAPARTPADALSRLNAEFVEALRQPAIRDRFHAMGLEPAGTTVEAFTRYVAEDHVRGQRLVKATGAKLD